MLGKIEHIGIAVKDLNISNQLFTSLLGTEPYKSEEVASEHVITSFFMAGQNKVELLQATHPDSAIAKYLENKPEGIHHIAFAVEDIHAELARLKAQFGRVVLFDAHSIPSQVPRFFEGQLPDLNIGTAAGYSCDSHMAAVAEEIAAESGYSWVVNGRFKGGYITRAYGQPAQGIHALQLELSQDTYLDEEQLLWDPVKAQGIMPVLQELLEGLVQWATQA